LITKVFLTPIPVREGASWKKRKEPIHLHRLKDNERNVMSKLSIVKEFWEFLKVRKKWWLAPIIIFLFLLGALIIFTEGSAVAPFIYTLF
jgi:hypothetical protein